MKGNETSRLRRFFLPTMDRRFMIRVAAVAAATYVVFGYVIVPVSLRGASMEPTYRDGQWNFCLRPGHSSRRPARGDVVCIRWVGRERMLLKRVVALEGQTVEFRRGALFVDDKPADEPYVVNKCDWNLEPRKVEAGQVYVIGDNRDMPIKDHYLGQVPTYRIEGVPLW